MNDSYSDQSLNNINKLSELLGNFKRKEPIGDYGYIIEKSIKEKGINQKGNITYKSRKIFNVLTYDNRIVCPKWFDIYISDKENCIVGYQRSYEDFQRINRLNGYTLDSGTLSERFQYMYGAINRFGNFIVEQLYDQLYFGNEDTLIGFYNGRYGYIDIISGKHITPIILDAARPFSENLACIAYHGEYGYISRDNIVTNPDHNSQYAIAPQYDWAEDFKNGYAHVYKNQQEIKINKYNIAQQPEMIQTNLLIKSKCSRRRGKNSYK